MRQNIVVFQGHTHLFFFDFYFLFISIHNRRLIYTLASLLTDINSNQFALVCDF